LQEKENPESRIEVRCPIGRLADPILASERFFQGLEVQGVGKVQTAENPGRSRQKSGDTARKGADTIGKGARPIEKGVRTIAKEARPIEKGFHTIGKGVHTIEKGVRTISKGASPIGKGVRPFLEVIGQNSRPGGAIGGVPVVDSSGKRQPRGTRLHGNGPGFTKIAPDREAFLSENAFFLPGGPIFR
jgi:hypothetical protein